MNGGLHAVKLFSCGWSGKPSGRAPARRSGATTFRDPGARTLWFDGHERCRVTQADAMATFRGAASRKTTNRRTSHTSRRRWPIVMRSSLRHASAWSRARHEHPVRSSDRQSQLASCRAGPFRTWPACRVCRAVDAIRRGLARPWRDAGIAADGRPPEPPALSAARVRARCRDASARSAD